MKLSPLYILLLCNLSGCSLTEKLLDAPIEQVTEQPKKTTLDSSLTFTAQYQNLLQSNMNSKMRKQNRAGASSQNINLYTRGITQELVGNLQYVNTTTPIAITSFVFLDDINEHATLVGNQIAEGLMHEFHKFGIPILDFKTTDFLRVTPEGDFILSRDFLELKPNLPIRYVLVGTLVKHQDGYLVNARVVGLKSKAVVGSAQSFIPEHVVQSLKNSKESVGIQLVSD